MRPRFGNVRGEKKAANIFYIQDFFISRLLQAHAAAGKSRNISDTPRRCSRCWTSRGLKSCQLAVARTKEGNETRRKVAAVALADVDCFNHIIAQPGAVKKRSVRRRTARERGNEARCDEEEQLSERREEESR